MEVDMEVNTGVDVETEDTQRGDVVNKMLVQLYRGWVYYSLLDLESSFQRLFTKLFGNAKVDIL